MPSCIPSNLTVLYADDSNFGITDKTIVPTVNRANICTTEFYEYCLSQGLLINISKTYLMSSISEGNKFYKIL